MLGNNLSVKKKHYLSPLHFDIDRVLKEKKMIKKTKLIFLGKKLIFPSLKSDEIRFYIMKNLFLKKKSFVTYVRRSEKSNEMSENEFSCKMHEWKAYYLWLQLFK